MNLNMSFQGAALAAYPLDTIRRRMMMTSGEKVDHFAHMLRTSGPNGCRCNIGPLLRLEGISWPKRVHGRCSVGQVR
jgi:hypothetical protein